MGRTVFKHRERYYVIKLCFNFVDINKLIGIFNYLGLNFRTTETVNEPLAMCLTSLTISTIIFLDI